MLHPDKSFLRRLSTHQLLEIFGVPDLVTLMERPSIGAKIACPGNPRAEITPPLEGALSEITCFALNKNRRPCLFSRGQTIKIVASRRGFNCFVNDEQVDPDKNPRLAEFLNTYDKRLMNLAYDLETFLNSETVFGVQAFSEELRAAVTENLERSLLRNDTEDFCSGPQWVEVCDPTTLMFATAPLEADETLAQFVGFIEGLNGERLETRLRDARKIRRLLSNQRCVILVNKAAGTLYSTLYRLVATRVAEDMLPETVRRVQNRIMGRNTRIFEGLRDRRQSMKDTEAAAEPVPAEEIPVEVAPTEEPVAMAMEEEVQVEPDSSIPGDFDETLVEIPQTEPASESMAEVTLDTNDTDHKLVEVAPAEDVQVEPAEAAQVAVINEAPADVEVTTDADKPADEQASSGEDDGVEDEPPVNVGDSE